MDCMSSPILFIQFVSPTARRYAKVCGARTLSEEQHGYNENPVSGRGDDNAIMKDDVAPAGEPVGRYSSGAVNQLGLGMSSAIKDSAVMLNRCFIIQLEVQLDAMRRGATLEYSRLLTKSESAG